MYIILDYTKSCFIFAHLFCNMKCTSATDELETKMRNNNMFVHSVPSNVCQSMSLNVTRFCNFSSKVICHCSSHPFNLFSHPVHISQAILVTVQPSRTFSGFYISKKKQQHAHKVLYAVDEGQCSQNVLQSVAIYCLLILLCICSSRSIRRLSQHSNEPLHT